MTAAAILLFLAGCYEETGGICSGATECATPPDAPTAGDFAVDLDRDYDEDPDGTLSITDDAAVLELTDDAGNVWRVTWSM